MVTVEAFAEYMALDYASSDRQGDMQRSLSVASAMIDTKLASAWRPMPAVIRDQCVLDTALAVYQRAENNNGQYNTESPNGPLDPMMRVKHIIDKYVMSL